MTPDLIAREVANGFWTVFPAMLGLILMTFGAMEMRRVGRNPINEGIVALALFLWASVIMRVWVWYFLWQVNHDSPRTARDDYWLSLMSMVLGAVVGSYLIYRMTPPESGHRTWVVVLILSVLVPLVAHFMPYLTGYSPWPAGWTG